MDYVYPNSRRNADKIEKEIELVEDRINTINMVVNSFEDDVSSLIRFTSDALSSEASDYLDAFESDMDLAQKNIERAKRELDRRDLDAAALLSHTAANQIDRARNRWLLYTRRSEDGAQKQLGILFAIACGSAATEIVGLFVLTGGTVPEFGALLAGSAGIHAAVFIAPVLKELYDRYEEQQGNLPSSQTLAKKEEPKDEALECLSEAETKGRASANVPGKACVAKKGINKPKKELPEDMLAKLKETKPKEEPKPPNPHFSPIFSRRVNGEGKTGKIWIS